MIPTFVTQTDEPPPWIDCTWAAALMMANKGALNTLPATRAEREALRAASGDAVGGSTTVDMIRGIEARYKQTPARPTTLARTAILLANGYGAALAVDYSKVPAAIRKWDPGFTGWHRVYVQGVDGTTLWWMDPLGRGSYKGEPVKIADIDQAVAWEQTLAVKEGSWVLTIATVLREFDPDRTFAVPAGKTLSGYSLTKPGKAVKTQTFTSPATASFDALVQINQSPNTATVPHGQFLRVTSGPFAGLYVARNAVVANVENEATYTQAQVDAKVAAAKEQVKTAAAAAIARL